MPPQKRYQSSQNLLDGEDSLQQQHRRKQSRRERRAEEEEERGRDDDEQVKEAEEDPDGEDSDGSRSSDDPAKLPEWIEVVLSDIRGFVQCPICLGIIKKTRAVMGCLHRFCRDCIDKSMRLGNNECPACRTHCASRRSLRDDTKFDAMIETLYVDIQRYEEEELAFHEEEKTRNKQIQASIAQIFLRQSEVAPVQKTRKNKEMASSSAARPQRKGRKYARRRRNTRGTEHEGSEDNEDESNHDVTKDSSSTDEQRTEVKQRRYKRRGGAQSSQLSPSTPNSDGGMENHIEASRETKGVSSGHILNPEMFAWGGGGARSKVVRHTRITKLTKYLENVKDDDEKFDVPLILVPLDKQRTPSFQQLFHSCPPHFSVECLKEYVAQKTQLQAEDIEILMMKHRTSTNSLQSNIDPSTSMEDIVALQILEGQETVAELRSNCASNGNHLILAYRLKARD